MPSEVRKNVILAEMRRVAEAHGGRLSLRAFLRDTRIGVHEIVGKHWATWNLALTEAGIATSTFRTSRTEDDLALEAFVQLVDRLGKWATTSELLLQRRRDSAFPSEKVFRRLKKSGDFPARVRDFADGPGLDDVAAIAARQIESDSAQASSVSRLPVQGCVYMMKSGRHYKIGRTTSPLRRHREVSLNLPMPTRWIHSIETDDPAGIEAYWHHRFEAKKVAGTGFFRLDGADVAAFKRREYQ